MSGGKREEAKHSMETGVPVEGQPNVNSLRHTGNRFQLAAGIFLESRKVESTKCLVFLPDC